MRIKAASNLWSEAKAASKIFTSDMVRYVEHNYKSTLDHRFNIKTSYAPMLVDGLSVAMVSWYDRFNVDLVDIDCPPYYKANDGTVNNLVTTGIINEVHNV
jgi:hypothetical protein